jgi:hypothetical protein
MMFLYTTFALSSSPKSTNVKPLIRGSTPPFENLPIFKSDFYFKGINPVLLREAELKHGRIAMLASIILPTLEQFTDGLGINQFQHLPDTAQLYLVSLMFVGEFRTMILGWENPTKKPFTLKDDYQPGDLGFGLWNIEDPSIGEQMDKELNNGRLAMIGVFGMICQELATGQQLF